MSLYTKAAISAAPGIVIIQAHTIFRVKPQRTAEILFAAPTPVIDPVITWVVLTGTPSDVATNKLVALAVSAQKPSIGRSFVIFCPMVFTILQPPIRVPRPIAALAATITQKGISNSGISPPEKSIPVIIPIVF